MTTDALWSQLKQKARAYGASGTRPSRSEAEAIVGELLENVPIVESVPGEAVAFYADELVRLSDPAGGVKAAPLVINLAGDLDSFACDDLRKTLRPTAQAAEVVLDLSEVRYIDSAGADGACRPASRTP